MAAELELEVEAAEELEGAVGTEAGAVAGFVETSAGAEGEGMRDEAVGGEGGPVEVAAGEGEAADVELAGDADRGEAAAWVEDEGLDVGEGAADGG